MTSNALFALCTFVKIISQVQLHICDRTLFYTGSAFFFPCRIMYHDQNLPLVLRSKSSDNEWAAPHDTLHLCKPLIVQQSLVDGVGEVLMH